MPLAHAIVIQTFTQTARPLMLKYMPRAACIGAVKTTIETMKVFGLRARGIPVAYSFEVAARNVARVGGLSKEQQAELKKENRWIDAGEPGWNGHLIVLVEDRWLLDPSIDQMEVPAFGVELDPEIAVFDLEGCEFNPEGFEMRLGLRLDDGKNAKLTYYTTHDTSYRDTEAWKDEGLPFLADHIAAHMVAHWRTLKRSVREARCRV